MQGSDLTLFVCETYREEVTHVVSGIPGIRIRTCFFPHFCSSGYQRIEEIRSFFSSCLLDGEAGLYFGDSELVRRGILPAGVHHAGPDSCHELIAPAEVIRDLYTHGSHLLVPGWILRWEAYVGEMGFDSRVPTAFYSSNLTESVVLDSGLLPIPPERIRSFEVFSGLSVRTIPVGISHITAIIRSEVFRWYADHIRSALASEVHAAMESGARQMAVITLLSDVARVSEERDAISRIFIVCESLFAPRCVVYLPFSAQGPGEPVFNSPCSEPGEITRMMMAASGKEYLISPDDDGFIIPVQHGQETMGILAILHLAFPDRLREYLNLMLSITRFLGLAIRNARSWQEIRAIQMVVEDANQELRRKNEELTSLSDELHAANRELVASQERLTESEKFITEIVNSLRIGIAVLDTSFTVRFWNPEMERVLQLRRPEIWGRNVLDVFPFLTRDGYDQFLHQALAGEEVRTADFEYPFEKGNARLWLSALFSPVRDSRGSISGILVSISDISRRKEDEQDLEKAYGAIHQAQEKLSILASITRHDILNRVMVVTAYSGMLLETASDPVSVKQLESMATAGKDIQHLIEFTRQYQELGVKKPVWQDIREVMQRRSLESLLSTISFSVSGPKVEIFVDQMLEKVLYNLVENSLRHGERVTEIRITMETDGDELLIIYTDNGIGVAEAEKDLIFKKGHGKNTGLGLFLIREILDLTRISIRENGIPGEGVRFEMRVPRDGWRLKLGEVPSAAV